MYQRLDFFRIFFLQFLKQSPFLAPKKEDQIPDVFFIFPLVSFPRAYPRTKADLIIKTGALLPSRRSRSGSGAVAERKYPARQRNGGFKKPVALEGSDNFRLKGAEFFRFAPAGNQRPGKFFRSRNHQINERAIVFFPHVEFRPVFFYQIRFQNDRVKKSRRFPERQTGCFRDKFFGPRVRPRRKIARNPLLQRRSAADVNYPSVSVFEKINARGFGKFFRLFFNAGFHFSSRRERAFLR